MGWLRLSLSHFDKVCLIIWILRLKNQDKHLAAREFFTNQYAANLIHFFINRIFDAFTLADSLYFYFRHYNLQGILTRSLNKYFSSNVIMTEELK